MLVQQGPSTLSTSPSDKRVRSRSGLAFTAGNDFCTRHEDVSSLAYKQRAADWQRLRLKGAEGSRSEGPAWCSAAKRKRPKDAIVFSGPTCCAVNTTMASPAAMTSSAQVLLIGRARARRHRFRTRLQARRKAKFGPHAAIRPGRAAGVHGGRWRIATSAPRAGRHLPSRIAAESPQRQGPHANQSRGLGGPHASRVCARAGRLPGSRKPTVWSA
jgi:hypothetical protein